MSELEILKTIWPVILLQLAFQIYALVDLYKNKKGKTKNLSSTLWAVIIVFGQIAGSALYFIFGRSEA